MRKATAWPLVTITFQPTPRRQSARKRVPAAVVFLLFVICSSVSARTWKVSPAGSGDTSSIQAAIAQASPEDSILVDPGTYSEAIDFLGKLLYVMSTDGPESTVIDASGLPDTSVVTFSSSEPFGTLLQGFTITGGTGTRFPAPDLPHGGGIFSTSGSPTLRSNIIRANSARFGGGIVIGSAVLGVTPSALLEDNIIEENTVTQNGGGMLIGSVTITLRNNVFRNNHAAFDGGGIWVFMGTGSMVMDRCRLSSNVAGDHGGGIHWFCETGFGCSGGSITFSIFDRNKAMGVDTGDNGSGGGLYIDGGPLTVSNNSIVLNGASGEVSCSGGGISIYTASSATDIFDNIIAFNTGCGVRADRTNVVLGSNILWQNTCDDWVGNDVPPNHGSALRILNPLFCDLDGGSFAVAENSPALQEGGMYGAVLSPGCPDVPVMSVTWSYIKLMAGRQRSISSTKGGAK